MSPTRSETPSSPDNKNVELKWFPLERLPVMYLAEQKNVIEKNVEKIKSLLSVDIWSQVSMKIKDSRWVSKTFYL